MPIMFDHPNKSLTQQNIKILLDKRSDRVYAHPNYTTTFVNGSCWATHPDRLGIRMPSGPFAQMLQQN